MSAPPPSISASGGAGDAYRSPEPLHSGRPAPPGHLKLPVIGSLLLSALARRDRVVDIEELHAQLNVGCTAASSPSRAPVTCTTDYLRAVTVLVAYRTYFFPRLGVQWVLYLHWLLGQADAPISTDQLKDIDVRARTHMCQNPWDYHDATSLTDAVQCSRPLSATTEPHRTDGQLPDSEDTPPEMDFTRDAFVGPIMVLDIEEEEERNVDSMSSPSPDIQHSGNCAGRPLVSENLSNVFWGDPPDSGPVLQCAFNSNEEENKATSTSERFQKRMVCHLCGFLFTNSRISQHFRRHHKISDVRKLKEVKQDMKKFSLNLGTRKPEVPLSDKLTCATCGARVHHLSLHLKRSHHVKDRAARKKMKDVAFVSQLATISCLFTPLK